MWTLCLFNTLCLIQNFFDQFCMALSSQLYFRKWFEKNECNTLPMLSGLALDYILDEEKKAFAIQVDADSQCLSKNFPIKKRTRLLCYDFEHLELRFENHFNIKFIMSRFHGGRCVSLLRNPRFKKLCEKSYMESLFLSKTLLKNRWI